MRTVTFGLSILVLWVLAAAAASAAPSLRITKSPLEEDPLYTGPAADPYAIQGQWFQEVGGTATAACTHEFYDNVAGSGGGWRGYLAIEGHASNVSVQEEDPGVPPYVHRWIDSFDIVATITNDAPATSPWLEGTNSHGESTDAGSQYNGTLYDVKLTAEFAVDIDALEAWDPDGTKRNSTPYFDMLPQIQAANHDGLAWYCWSPENDLSLEPVGEYLVPTWLFGDIAPGGSETRTLSFVGTIDEMDSLYGLLTESEAMGSDLLFNRSTSLKISSWQDGWAIDTGVDYPDSPGGGSNVSVFCTIPEPGTGVMLLGFALAGVFVCGRRRRRR